ncbi:flagella basal body P-ring formation protein FlgA [Sphingomonas sp.]|uniref:flagella basal body P-ring formation protein FlgA n=1 Tax=Sphingomonas sp. TaxID=28214 RepID=UPI001EC4DADD|nr:flagella basal body P-ring formation protein FlgA [Sphingomonas sp.]MBX3595311.1 flagella basal body P-ring formation protein FlgA [Sphingomonas sp.]
MIAILLPIALAAAGGETGGFQSTEALDKLVERFVGAPIGAEGGARAAVDKRLKLAACDAPELSWRSSAEDAVVIRCQGPKQWRLFVAIDALPKPVAAPTLAVAPAPVQAKPEIVIKRGDPILIEAGSAGFSITSDGVAMADASAGGRVLVKVDDKRPPIAAIAVEPGRARLPGFGD